MKYVKFILTEGIEVVLYLNIFRASVNMHL